MLNISPQDQKLLYKQASLKKLENNLYLRDHNNENYKYIKKKFFLREDHEKAELLNIGSWLFGTIADVFAYYVWTPDHDFWTTMDEFVRDLISLWFCAMWISRIDWELQITYEPAKNYWNDNWVDKISRLYLDEEDNMYVLVSSYFVGRIENRLYAMPWSTLYGWVQVPLDTIRQTAWLEEDVDTGLDIPALLVVEDSDYSMLEKIKNMVYGVDRQIVMNHTQYLQNVESFILFKNIKRPTKLLEDYNNGKRIDFSQIGRIVNGWDDSQIEFIDNVNTLIDKSIQDTDNYIRRISATTTVPIEFLWLESKEGAVGMGSRTLRHWAFIKKVQYYRDILDEALMQFVDVAWLDVNYSWGDVFAKNDKELVEELKDAREAGIVSQLEAIKRYSGYDDDEAERELELINGQSLPITNEEDE